MVNIRQGVTLAFIRTILLVILFCGLNFALDEVPTGGVVQPRYHDAAPDDPGRKILDEIIEKHEPDSFFTQVVLDGLKDRKFRLCNCTVDGVDRCIQTTQKKLLEHYGLENVCIGYDCYVSKERIQENGNLKYKYGYGCFEPPPFIHTKTEHQHVSHNIDFDALTHRITTCSGGRYSSVKCCDRSFCNGNINLEALPDREIFVIKEAATHRKFSWDTAVLLAVVVTITVTGVCCCFRRMIGSVGKLKENSLMMKCRSLCLSSPEPREMDSVSYRTGATPASPAHNYSYMRMDEARLLDFSGVSGNQSATHSSNVTQITTLSNDGSHPIEYHPLDTLVQHSSSEQPCTLVRRLLDDLDTTNSGSGSGLPQLTPRTLARQITLEREIGQGKFGQVWLGHWFGDRVSVKIFTSRDEKSWARECETFATNMLRHNNILRFIGNDRKDNGIQTELWLITEYHELGSLFDYLTLHTLDEHDLLQMLRGIANGLAFLHMEMSGTKIRLSEGIERCVVDRIGFSDEEEPVYETQHTVSGLGKPAFAHRDMKISNILVRRDHTCVIADLGLAFRCDNGRMNLPETDKCGTVRYLAPELLDGTIQETMFDSYRQADMYAFGLCMWEMARRTVVPEGAASPMEEALAYWEDVPRDPSLAEMTEVVCVGCIRPQPSQHWNNNEVMREVYRQMRGCYAAAPASRLTAGNVKRNIDRVAAKHGYVLIQ